MSVKKNLRLDVACRFMAASCVLTAVVLTGCSEDGTRTVTVGDDEPVLELPEKLKNANPNVRSLMQPKISSRIADTDDWTSHSDITETATSVVGDNSDVDAADAVTLPSEVLESGNYDVRVEWTYPQQQADDHVDLGTIVYEIRSDDGNPPDSEIAEEITDLGKETNPLGLDNIQLLNSLYKGEDAASIDLASVESSRPWNNYQAIQDINSIDLPGRTVYIADYVENIDYDAVIGARWGIEDELKIKALEGSNSEVLEDFENVQLSAIGSNEAMYFQLANLNPDGSPFEYQVLVSTEDASGNELPFEAFTNGNLVFSENPTTESFQPDDSSPDRYAYRWNPQLGRLDYRQNRPTDVPLVNTVDVDFFLKDDEGSSQKVAEWRGVVLFGTQTQAEPNLVLTVSDQNGNVTSGREFPECTPFIITAQLNGVDEPESVIYTFTDDYDGDFLSGTLTDFDEGVAENMKNYRLPPAINNEQYIYTINVEANVSGQPQTEAKTSSVEFTVNDDEGVRNVCP